MSELLLKDKAARERIKTEIDKNFFVEAGAGSGKTYSLVQRMVAMVKGGIDVSKICAITFTKAAAAEFYSRFHKELVNESRSNALTPEEKANVDNALKKIDLCFMGTIDSFCNLVISEHPGEASVPSDSQIKSDDEMKGIYLRELSAIANGDYGKELKEKYILFDKYNYYSKKLFTKGTEIISGLRNCETVVPEPMDTDLDRKFSAEKKELLRFLDRAADSGDFTSDDARKKFISLMEEKYVIEGSWNRRPSSLIYILNELVKDDIRLDINTALAEEFPDFTVIRGKRTQYFGISTGADNRVLKYLKDLKYYVTIDFLVSAVNAISEKLCSEGSLGFFDYMFYLRNMLRDDAAGEGRLIKHIYERHSYFLIDEFQDTNPMQAEIFFYLAAENPVSDWKKCVPKPGSLFVVGDPKQSIYRFRNADVTSYLNVKEIFTDGAGEVLYLTRNFRSTKLMCDYFNGIFSTLLPENTEIQSKFEPIPTDENETPEGCFGGIYSYDISGDSLYDGALTAIPEEEAVADIITGITGNPDYLIKGKGDKSPRMIEYRDFMIIVNSKKTIKVFVSALKKRGIASKTEGYVSFADCPALTETLKIFSAVADPMSPAAVYGALKGKVFGITEGEILEFRNAGGRLSPYDDSVTEGCEKVREALLEIRSLVSSAQSKSAAAVFALIREKLRIIEVTGSEYLECWYYALELLRDAESKSRIMSLKEAAQMMSDLTDKDAKSEQERCISLSENENRVHIANLHKVKGLEAEIVILAKPKSKGSGPQFRTADTDEGRKNWVFRIKKDKGDGRSYLMETDLFEEESNLEADCLNAEKDRLRYVAATRARSALIVSRSVSSSKSGAGKELPANHWKGLVDSEKASSAVLLMSENYEGGAETVSASELYTDEKDTVVSRTESFGKTFEIKRPSMLKVKSKADEESGISDDADGSESISYKGNAAVTGTIVHRLMEKLISSRNTIGKDEAVSSIIAEFGLENTVYKNILTDVYGRIQSGGYDQKNRMTKDILGELLSADEVYCEVPFCRKEQNGDSFILWNGVMDVIYRNGEGWHIVDYKTNADPDDLDEKYRKQLDAYIAAFRELTGNAADALIYHIDI